MPSAFLSLSLTAAVAAIGSPAKDPSPVPPPSLTAPELEAWLDGYLPSALRRNDMVGALVVVVKGGAVLLAKGYGLDDVAAGRPVDPSRTLWPLASISKSVTATAVMQLVEQGRLDLDRDVNEYLDFRIPSAFSDAPITLRHLLTHSAGFDDLQKGSSPADSNWYLPLGRYLARRAPNRIYRPGVTPAYSNYGFGLAARIVELVSGEPYERYVARHIFEPLGMDHTTAEQPPPAEWRVNVVKPYLVGSGPVQRPEFTNTRGAGGIVTTGTDLARFMIAHLERGAVDSVHVLRPETVELMHAPAFSPVPHIKGMALGFFRLDYNGRSIIGHDGDTKGVHSSMALLRDEDVGIFVDFNADGNGGAVYSLREAVITDFIDRYFPAPVPNEPTAGTAAEHARMMAGSYQSSRRLSGVLSVFMLLNGVRVIAQDDGTIAMAMPPAGILKRFHEVGPFLWREVGGKALVEARVVDGRVVSIHNDPAIALIKVPWWRSFTIIGPMLVAAVLIVIASVIGAIGRAGAHAPRDRWSRLAIAGQAAMLLFLAGWVFLASNLLTHFYLFNAGLDPWLRLLHGFGLLGIGGAVPVIARAVAGWRDRLPWRGLVGRTTLGVAMIWLAWFSVTFNLITPTLDY